LFGHTQGLGSLQRASPLVLGRVARALLNKGGLVTMGRIVPVVSAPLSAYLNNRHLQAVGEEAVRHYDGFRRASLRAAAGAVDDSTR
jgi:hypothetical protein